jgi:glucose-6-phosphate isomerase
VSASPLPLVRLDYTNCTRQRLGSRAGIGEAALRPLLRRGERALADLLAEARAGKLGFAELPTREDLARESQRLAHRFLKRFDTLLVLGMGGSALGARALIESLARAGAPSSGARRLEGRVIVLDTLEPAVVQGTLRGLDPRRTVVNVVSKSGDTLETAALFQAARERFGSALGAQQASRHFVFTVGPERGELGEWARQAGAELVEMPGGVGGRFSVLTQVGLLPAAFAGVDVRAVVAGASRMADVCHLAPPARNPALVSAALLLLERQRGRSTQVVFHYGRALRGLAAWYAQLWAESLGKRFDMRGRRIDWGQTPLVAEGPADQHSLLQLLLEGPDDKVVTFWEVERHGEDGPLPRADGGAGVLGMLAGKRLADLMCIQKRATAVALTRAGRPNMTLSLPELGAHAVGQLLYLLEYQTAVAGRLLGLNAFDQPAVEFGKKVARALLGGPAEPEQRRWLRRAGEPDERYVI